MKHKLIGQRKEKKKGAKAIATRLQAARDLAQLGPDSPLCHSPTSLLLTPLSLSSNMVGPSFRSN